MERISKYTLIAIISWLSLILFNIPSFSGDNCPQYNENPCTVNCSGCGPRHQYTVKCSYKTNYRCVDGSSSSYNYELKTIPASITIYNNSECNSSTTAPEKITDLPHTFSNQISPRTITSVPVTLKILSHYCAYDTITPSCTCGD